MVDPIGEIEVVDDAYGDTGRGGDGIHQVVQAYIPMVNPVYPQAVMTWRNEIREKLETERSAYT